MAMNYNDIEAPNFVDFGGNFEEEGEGDSWFSNDSINFDSADVTLDKSQDTTEQTDEPATESSVTPPVPSADTPPATATSKLTAPPTSAYFPSLALSTASASSSTMEVGSTASLASSAPSSAVSTPATTGSAGGLVTREEFEKNRKVAHFAATPPQQKRSATALERKNSRRKSLRKAGASLVRSARKAAIRARDKMTPKKTGPPAPATTSKPITKPGGLTQIQPFQLSTESRSKRLRGDQSIVSNASTVTMTPPAKKPARVKKVEPFAVSAKPTAASTAQRAVFKSAAEMQMKFITKTPERFRTKKIAGSAAADEKAEKEKISRTILDPTFLQTKGKLPTKNKQAATCPKSPAFALKNRKRRRPEEEATESAKTAQTASIANKAKTNATAKSGIKSALKTTTSGQNPDAPRKNVTIPQPFECHTRSQEMMEHKEKAIEKVLDEERAKREFHAQPLPDLSTAHVPPKKHIPATNPKPFNLMTDERGVSKEQDFENRLKEEAEEKKKMVEFKAQAPKVLDQAPFVPKASRKPLVEFQEFNLATNERAEVWEENEAKKAERNAEMQALEEERARMTKEAEDREIKKMREEMVHKPIPVPNYKPIEIHGSEKPMTIPESPNWSKRATRNNSKL